MFCKQKKAAVIACAIIIMAFSLLRDYYFQLAIDSQPKFEINNLFIDTVAWISISIGQFMVLASYYKLGFYSTFLGDYFGIFTHSEPIVTFPFSVCADPMY